MMEIKDKKRFLITTLFYLTIIMFIVVFLKYLLPALLPFVVGFFIAMLLKPIWISISKITKSKLKFAGFITVLSFYLLLFLLVFLLGKRLFTEAVSLLSGLPSLIREIIIPFINNTAEKINSFLQNTLKSNINTDYFSNSVSAFTDKLVTFTANIVTKLVKTGPSLIVGTVLTIISTFYFALDYYKITSFLTKLLPKNHRNKVFEFKEIFGDKMLNMIKGYMMIMLITFAEVFVGLSLLRTKNSLVLSIIIAAVDLLPIFGSGTFLIPISILGFLNGRISYSVGVLILYAIITVIREIIEPKIIGKRIGLPTIVMLLSAYVGLKLFGFSGLIVLPLIITVIKEYLSENHKTILNEQS